MFKWLSVIVYKLIGRHSKYKSEADKKLQKLIKDMAEPVVIDWELSESDHRVISTYVEMFIRDNDIDVLKMAVSPDIYPKLHRFIVALQGDCHWQESMAAYDYLENKWPELIPLLDKA